MRGGCMLAAVAGLGILAGCAASTYELRQHPQQERLERLTATILPVTEYPSKHYWVRVCQPDEQHRIGLTILPNRHVYFASDLLEQADDAIVTALLAHGIAHHRLQHFTKRGGVNLLQRVAFKVGGFFVPGLGYGRYVGDPIVEGAFSGGHESGADKKTVAYLRAMGRSPADLARALEFLIAHGYGERTGGLVSADRELQSRRNRLPNP